MVAQTKVQFLAGIFLLLTVFQRVVGAPIEENERMKRSPTCPTCGAGGGGGGAVGAGDAAGAGGEDVEETTPVWCKPTNVFRYREMAGRVYSLHNVSFRSRVRVDEKCKELAGA